MNPLQMAVYTFSLAALCILFGCFLLWSWQRQGWRARAARQWFRNLPFMYGWRVRRFLLGLLQITECYRCGCLTVGGHAPHRCCGKLYEAINERETGIEPRLKEVERKSELLKGEQVRGHNSLKSLILEQEQVREGQVEGLIHKVAEVKRDLRQHINQKPPTLSNVRSGGPVTKDTVKVDTRISLLIECLPYLDLLISEHNDGKRLHRRICETLAAHGFPGFLETYYSNEGGHNA